MTTWVSWHQKGKPFWILLEQETMGWQWHQLDHMQIICTSLQTDTTPVPHHSVFTGRMLFLTPKQQCQTTEGQWHNLQLIKNLRLVSQKSILHTHYCMKCLNKSLCKSFLVTTNSALGILVCLKTCKDLVSSTIIHQNCFQTLSVDLKDVNFFKNFQIIIVSHFICKLLKSITVPVHLLQAATEW